MLANMLKFDMCALALGFSGRSFLEPDMFAKLVLCVERSRLVSSAGCRCIHILKLTPLLPHFLPLALALASIAAKQQQSD